MLSKIICEKELPIPWDTIPEEERKTFTDTKWDERDFYTGSIFDYEIEADSYAIYTISEDGQFYKNLIKIEVKEDKSGQLITEERDMGIEKQDFTGLVLFGTEILSKDKDHSIDFKALFYKGELKELELEKYKTHSNKERKAAAAKVSEHFRKEAERQRSLKYKICRPLKKVACFIISTLKWVLHKTFGLLLRIEGRLLK